MNKKLLISFLSVGLLSLSACSGPGEGGGNNDPITPEEAAAYEKSLDNWSQAGHVYLHYRRTTAANNSEYDDWGIWMWPNAPQDLEGSMWGAVNPASLATVPHPMTTKRIENTNLSQTVDRFGAIYDIDLTRTDIVGGKTGKSISFEGATKVGFLVAKLSSMDGNDHWVSDGGANLYIEDFQTHWRKTGEYGAGSMHLFLTQGDCANFKFAAGGDVEVNPTINDVTGAYRSVESTISDKYIGQVAPTSGTFRQLGVGYQVFVASFRDSNGDGMGDIKGITAAINDKYFEKLNVQCLWLTPVFKCESYHGYDTVDYYSIDGRFGTDADFEELLQVAHANGIQIILDLVLNHTSKNNVWYRNSQKAAVSIDPALGREVSWRNIYHWKFEGDTVKLYDNGIYTDVAVENHPDWYKDGESKYYYYGKFGSGMPELNYDNQQTRDLVIALGNYWLDKGVDGYRLDAVKHIYMKDEVSGDTGGDQIVADTGSKSSYDEELKQFINKSFDYSSDVTRNVQFWKEFAFGLKNHKSSCFLVGENFDGYGARIAPYYQALDSQFDFSNFYHIDEWAFRKVLHNASDYSSSQINDAYTFFRSNADNSHISGVPGNYPTGHRNDFINGAFTSNHDTLRAINHVNPDSLTEVPLKDENNQPVKDNKGNPIIFTTSKVTGTAAEVGKAKVAAAMTILNSGLSWIYYGDELGMSSNTDTHIEKYKNPNNEDLWYRQPLKWGDASITPSYQFNSYTVEWDSYNATLPSVVEQNGNNNSMLEYYRGLTAIKALMGSNTRYVEFDNTYSNQMIATWKIVSSTGTWYVYVNTTEWDYKDYGPHSGTFYKVDASTSKTSSESVIQPYSTVVIKE